MQTKKGYYDSVVERSVLLGRSDGIDKRDRVLECMKDFPQGVMPMQIATRTDINQSTVGNILANLVNGGKIRKVHTGMYVIVEGVDSPLVPEPDLNKWKFHRRIAIADIPDYKGNGWICSYSYGTIYGTFEVSKKGRASYTTNSVYPLDMSSWSSVFMNFKLSVEMHCGWSMKEEDVMIPTIEINYDYSNLKLEGVKCVRLNTLTSEYKAYQKSSGLRVEHRPKGIVFQEDIRTMLMMPPMEVSLKREMNRLTNVMVRFKEDVAGIRRENKAMNESVKALVNKLGELFAHLKDAPIEDTRMLKSLADGRTT